MTNPKTIADKQIAFSSKGHKNLKLVNGIAV